MKTEVAEVAQQINETILQQLGGRMFVTMTGVNDIRFDEYGSLYMKIGKNAKGVTNVKIRLTPLDDYEMIFHRISGRVYKNHYIPNGKIISIVEHVYCDQLCEVFERETGLYTHL